MPWHFACVKLYWAISYTSLNIFNSCFVLENRNEVAKCLPPTQYSSRWVNVGSPHQGKGALLTNLSCHCRFWNELWLCHCGGMVMDEFVGKKLSLNATAYQRELLWHMERAPVIAIWKSRTRKMPLFHVGMSQRRKVHHLLCCLRPFSVMT